jgi:N-acetyl-beta-hexosaminidase
VLFPKDISQVPDVIFYFADSLEDSRRHSFVRVPAASLLDKVFDNVLTLKEDKSLNLVKDDEFGGFLSVEATLFSESASTRHQMNDEIFPDVPYELRIFLYVARHLPPSDTSGSSDAYIKVRCAGKVVASQVVYKTLNPDWYETLKIGVLL